MSRKLCEFSYWHFTEINVPQILSNPSNSSSFVQYEEHVEGRTKQCVLSETELVS